MISTDPRQRITNQHVQHARPTDFGLKQHHVLRAFQHIANEGKLIAIVPPAEADAALRAMRAAAHGADAAIIGEVLEGPQDMVLLKTEAGGSRVLDMLVGDPLPRIC